jgi:hypothetical protein
MLHEGEESHPSFSIDRLSGICLWLQLIRRWRLELLRLTRLCFKNNAMISKEAHPGIIKPNIPVLGITISVNCCES